MRLGVNAVRFTRPFTGVGRYMEYVLLEWSRMTVPFDEITLFAPAPLRQEALAFPLARYRVRVIGRPWPDPVWEWRWLGQVAAEVAVLFCPSYTVPLGYRGRSLVTNLGPAENVPGTYQWWRSLAYERLYRISAHRADVVCACSESVKRRLIEVYGVPDAKVHVTYLAAAERFHPIGDPARLAAARRRCLGDDRPFVLFVGKLAVRHAIPNLLEAFARLRRRRDLPHALVLVGPDYLGLDVPARARGLGIGDAVVHVPYLGHDELPALYGAAELFVFPATEAEGFGIPVVEAMACGTPVVTVACGSLREFAPGAAELAASSDTADLESAMERVLGDPALRRRLAAAGIERARTLTWRRTAEQTMDLLWSLATRAARPAAT